MKKIYNIVVAIVFTIFGFVLGLIISNNNVKTDFSLKTAIASIYCDEIKEVKFNEYFLSSFIDSTHPLKINNNKIVKAIERINNVKTMINDGLNKKKYSTEIDSLKIYLKENENLENILISLDKIQNSKKEEKLFYLDLIGSFLISDYFLNLQKESLPYVCAKVINVAYKDTVKLGEIYHSELLFSVFDITNNHCFITENGDTIVNGIFEEKAVHLGENKYSGLFRYQTLYAAYYYPFAISYYVK